jgi:hypothetical protein
MPSSRASTPQPLDVRVRVVEHDQLPAYDHRKLPR